jgi:hypothetical protein
MSLSSIGSDGQQKRDGEYDALLTLEDLESLLEELEEAGVEGEIGSARLEGDLRQRVNAAGISNTETLRARIARMHARLDEEDFS